MSMISDYRMRHTKFVSALLENTMKRCDQINAAEKIYRNITHYNDSERMQAERKARLDEFFESSDNNG